MLNQSNNIEQLHIFISRKILEYFSNSHETITSRYALYFDSLENIVDFQKTLVDILSSDDAKNGLIARIGGDDSLEINLAEPFKFYNDDGGLEYEAIQISINNADMDRRIVFVADCDENKVELGDAFKNSIRNKFVDEQQNGILFYLSIQNVASVSKTTENFQRQGMPLSVQNVYDYLRAQISIIANSNQQKVVLYSLEKIKSNKPQNDNSLLEFAPIIRIIENQVLSNDDFHDLHMFTMSLTDLGKKDCNLAENYRLFRDVSLALSDNELDSMMTSYSSSIINTIKKAYEKDEENWDKNISFETIQKNRKANQKKFKLESSLVSDAVGNELSHDYYLEFKKPNSASYVFCTKNYDQQKISLTLKFTQKANVVSDVLKVDPLNTRGTAYRITLECDECVKNGTVVFEGGKDGKYTVVISVIKVPLEFFSSTCNGLTKNYNYQFVATDYQVKFGEGISSQLIEYQISPKSAPITVNSDESTTIRFKFEEGESSKDHAVKFNIDDNTAIIDTTITFEQSKLSPVEMYKVFNQCMIDNDSFEIIDEKLVNIHKQSEKYSSTEFDVAGKKYDLFTLFELEKVLITSQMLNVKTVGLKVLQEIKCTIPADVLACYKNICTYFSGKNTTPSLCSFNSDIKKLYEDYINAVLAYVGDESSNFQDKQQLSNEIFHLFKLGMIEDDDGLIWLSPLNPLSVAYQLELNNPRNRWVELDSFLYESLGFGNMLPFLTDSNDNVYQVINGKYPVQWACYCDASQSIKGDANTYYKKIEDYYLKFKYLFDGIANKSFKINVIGIQHTSEIIQSLFKLYNSRSIDSKQLYLEINYYYKGIGKNDFDSMTELDYVCSVARDAFGNKKESEIDVFCRWYMENVKYYSKPDNGVYSYAHISFCAFQNDKKSVLTNTISSSKSGVMLGGLISDIPSSLDKESGIYKYGFGIGCSEKVYSESDFLKLAKAYNELAKCKEGSPVSRDLSIAQGVQNTKSERLDAIYKASNWVVFVEPKIDLDFFIEQDNESDDDLIIIHYPDKNVTSTGYTSITVTQKSDQYINVIQEYLIEKLPMFDKAMDVKSIIKNFNAYSGEWLMNFINDKQIEEKISLVSAIDFCRRYFSNAYPDYTWIPVALDEVLRVTGSIGGTMTNVLFSKKVLISRGIIESQSSTSDDLLMAGVKICNGKTYLTYIPVEVKHGNCDSKTRNEAHNQVCNTAQLLINSFYDDSSDKLIDRKIYRNYMIQHVVSNAEKMLSYKIVNDSQYKDIAYSDIRTDLYNDNYVLELGKDTDKFAFYFSDGITAASKTKNSADGVIEIAVPLSDMYRYLVDPQQLNDDVKMVIDSEMGADATLYDISIPEEFESDDDTEIGDSVTENLEVALSEINTSQFSAREQEAIVDTSVQLETNEKPAESRVLIGKDTAKNSIYWEFGNKSLANRHLLITGTSGQGKTYSIQTMLYEMSKTGVSSVIIDYTDGYMKHQLDRDFLDRMSDKIVEHYIIQSGVPINPFISHEIDLGGTVIKEKPALVASRIADVFSHVYDFGEQQYSAVFSAVLNGINKFGDKMNMMHFQDELEELQESNHTAKSVASKMEPFFHTVSFAGDNEFDWGDILYNDEGTLHIFQLTVLGKEMQLIVAELLLWDAWYYTKKYGNKDKPFVVVLDEAQRLSHKSKSPSASILTEGRKFGWSAWFATQSLKILKDEEVVRLSQSAFKLYFKPTEDEIVKTSKLLDPAGETDWKPTVKGLQKGQCIVVGNRTNSNGVFGATQPTVVSVTSFDER